MSEVLWYTITHPATIAGRDGGGTLIVLAAVVACVTAIVMATVARRLTTRHPILAVVTGAAFLPLAISAIALLAAQRHPTGTDGGGMLIFVALVLSVCAVPVTLATSILCVWLMRRRRVD